MVQSTLGMTYTEIETEVARFLGYPRAKASWSDNQLLDMIAIIKLGLRQFYFPQPAPVDTAKGMRSHRWSFLRPQAELSIWDDVIADDAITVSTAVYDSDNDVTTITASEDAFYETMEEKTMAFDENSNTYVIDEYVSTTQVKVIGDASGEAGNTITIDSEDTFTLPWDFGALSGDGKFYYSRDSNRAQEIALTSDAKIRQMRTASVSTGTPYLAAITPLRTDATQQQRFTVQFHPPPSDVFVLTYRYHILPDALIVTTKEYPYGSVAHSLTLLESCLATAEIREKDDASTAHQVRFATMLQGSIDHDKQYGESVIEFGYNGDNSDDTGDGDQLRNFHCNPPLTMYDSQVWG